MTFQWRMRGDGREKQASRIQLFSSAFLLIRGMRDRRAGAPGRSVQIA
jgi:hypothetical protein